VNKLKEPDSADIQRQNMEAQRQAALKMQTDMGATLAAPIEITVNINGEEGRYLKCGVQLEYDPADIQLGTELEARKARMKDIIIDIMSSKSLSDLMSNDGKKAIREQIVAEVNNILPEEVGGKPLGKVRRSYFDSFIMQ
jgi:flagellar FliL protein